MVRAAPLEVDEEATAQLAQGIGPNRGGRGIEVVDDVVGVTTERVQRVDVGAAVRRQQAGRPVVRGAVFACELFTAAVRNRRARRSVGS